MHQHAAHNTDTDGRSTSTGEIERDRGLRTAPEGRLRSLDSLRGIAALAVVRPDWAGILGRFATAERDAAVTRATVEKAGAIDGVTARREATVDGFGPEMHAAVIGELRRIAWANTAD